VFVTFAGFAALAPMTARAQNGPALGFRASGEHSVRLRVYTGDRGPPSDMDVPLVDARLRPGQSATLPFTRCYWWQRTYGESDIDWSPIARVCPPPTRAGPWFHLPPVVWIDVVN
jgi:hypothetical protein